MGLMPGDLIVAVNSKAISGPSELDRLLASTKPGQEIKLEVKRSPPPQKPAAAPNEDGEAPKAIEASPVSLSFTAKLTEHPLDLIRLASTGGDDEVIGNISRLACRVTLSQLGNQEILTGKSAIQGLEWISNATYEHELKTDDAHDITFSLPITASELKNISDGPLTITRSYSLPKGSYLIDMNVAVENRGTTPKKVAYRLEGPCGVTLEGWWYVTKISPNFFGGAAARDVIYNSELNGHRLVSGYNLLKRAKKQPKEPDENVFVAEDDEAARSLRYAGIDAQYFNVAYVPPKDSSVLTGFQQFTSTLVADANVIPIHKERAADVSFYLDSIAADLPPGAALRQPLRMYAGPKVPELIEPFGLDNSIEYGWFGGVSKILGGILHSLYSMVGNYAIAIVLLTVLVRACLFPVSRKAAIHAQRMQELAPELKKINDKFKDDMEGRLKAQREFQKRVGFNPLAGCLPAFLQLPIFIGLYRCLSVDIELRQATFASTLQWASNLAGPDMFYHWGDWLWDYLSGRGTGWLGPYFNILPVIVVVLFLVQQKMFMPPPTDEQQAVTQKVMTVMTMMMALFFFRVPAGLCIYFITSSLWGIAERIVVKKTIPQSKVALATGDVVEGTITARTTPEKMSIADRIRNQMNPEPPKALPPGKRKKPPGKK
jgi:YidC/Oxa1 family membrane protein insertase